MKKRVKREQDRWVVGFGVYSSLGLGAVSIMGLLSLLVSYMRLAAKPFGGRA